MNATAPPVPGVMIISLLIGAALVFAVTMVVVSLIKSGRGAAAAVTVIGLLIAGMLMVGLTVPVFVARQAVLEAPQPIWVQPQLHDAPWPMPEAPAQPTMKLLPMHPEETPFPSGIQIQPHDAPPAQETPPPAPADPAAPAEPLRSEVTSDAEMNPTVEARADESSASPVPAAELTQKQAASPSASSSTTAESHAGSTRPAWVTEPQLPTRDVVLGTVLHVGPYSTLGEVSENMMDEVNNTLRNYMETHVGHGASRLIKLPPGYIVDHGVIADRWSEVTDSPSLNQPMHNLYVRFLIDRSVQNDLEARFDAARVESRLGVFGLGGGVLLALLGTLYGYLRLDTMTQGYYTGRLRFAAGLTGLSTLGAAAGLLAKHVVMWV